MSRVTRFWRRGARLAGVTVAAVVASVLVVGAAVAGPPPDDTTTTTTAPETTTTTTATTTTSAAPETTTTSPEAPSPGQGQGDVGALGAHQVTTGLDVVPGSYRAAILAANADGTPVTINFDPGLTVTLTTGDVAYTNTQPITLNGNGSTIDGGDAHQILEAEDASSVTVNNLTMRNGETLGNGGAIETNDGDVTVSNSTFSGNTGGDGGGAWTQTGSYTISSSTFSGNAAGGDGGGARTSSGSYTISSSTFSGNAAGLGGGGARTNSGSYTISNSTFSGNSAGSEGGALRTGTGGVTLVYATVVDNASPIGVNVATGALTSFGSVVALPHGSGANCAVTTTTSRGWNFSDDTSCGFTDSSRGDNQAVGNNPQLVNRASNGGPTQTHRPVSGSPLVNAIPGAHCQDFEAAGVSTDQRGVSRPQGPGCDIGSVERQVCPAEAAQASLGAGNLAGAEGVVAIAPLGAQFLWRRRRKRAGGRPRPPRQSRLGRARSLLTWMMVAGVAVAVLAACQPVKKTPPIC